MESGFLFSYFFLTFLCSTLLLPHPLLVVLECIHVCSHVKATSKVVRSFFFLFGVYGIEQHCISSFIKWFEPDSSELFYHVPLNSQYSSFFILSLLFGLLASGFSTDLRERLRCCVEANRCTSKRLHTVHSAFLSFLQSSFFFFFFSVVVVVDTWTGVFFSYLLFFFFEVVCGAACDNLFFLVAYTEITVSRYPSLLFIFFFFLWFNDLPVLHKLLFVFFFAVTVVAAVIVVGVFSTSQ